MITPVDFRQKSFRTGIGYDKKDVDSFMVELLRNYEELYRSNAQQISEIKDLSDNIVRYQAMEESLQRELMVAEKTSEEMVKDAADKAKKIESDAKAKAKQLVRSAKEDLAFTHNQTVQLARMYASMKAQLNLMFKHYVDIVNSEDLSMDIDAMEAFGEVPEDIKDAINASEVVPEMNFAASAYIQAMPMPGNKGQGSNNAAFGAFNGDPQMRDESPLGGMSDGSFTGTISGERGDVATAGFGFSSLAESDTFKDPFAGVETESTNEYDDGIKDPFAGTASTSQQTTHKKTKKKVVKEEPEYARPPYDESAYAEEAYEEAAYTEADYAGEDYAQEAPAEEYSQPDYSSVDNYDTSGYSSPSYGEADSYADSAAYGETDAYQSSTAYTGAASYQETGTYASGTGDASVYSEEIPTVNFNTGYDMDEEEEESDALQGDIEERKPAGPRLLGNSEEEDEDFSFS